uniref:RING-type domain-containing protein n=1 Tax=viral metagenome TaxID=1070528 RepID=A0A6C0B203_9ZZZZ
MSRTRSGKTYNTVLPVCSFCNGQDHTIQQCQTFNSATEELHKKTVQASIFSDYMTGHSETFLKMWLQTLTINQLHALGDYFTCFQNTSFNNTSNKKVQINRISSSYFWLIAGHPTRTQFNNISDETFLEFKEILQSHMNPHHYNLLEEIVLQERPWLRKFHIKVITRENSNSNNEKNCGICFSNNIDPLTTVSTNCNHDYCQECFSNHIKSFRTQVNREPNCAYCRTKITTINTINPEHINYYKNYICNATNPLLRAPSSMHLVYIFN